MSTETFATRVNMPVVYQPLVDVTNARRNIKKIITRISKNIRESNDPVYRAAMLERKEKLKVIHREMKQLEEKL